MGGCLGAACGCLRRTGGKRLAGNAKQDPPDGGATSDVWGADDGWDDVESGTAVAPPSVAAAMMTTSPPPLAPSTVAPPAAEPAGRRGLRMDRAVARDKKARITADGVRLGSDPPLAMKAEADEPQENTDELFAELGLNATYKRPKKHMRVHASGASLVDQRAVRGAAGGERRSLLALAANAGGSSDDDDGGGGSGWGDEDDKDVSDLLRSDEKAQQRQRREQHKEAMLAKRELRKLQPKVKSRFAMT